MDPVLIQINPLNTLKTHVFQLKFYYLVIYA